MTFENSAWAIDGALLSSSLARRAEYAAVGGAEGIVQRGDLKVSQLDVPGVGVQIAPGVGLIANQYQDNPNETYVVSNPGVHTVPQSAMPTASPSARSFFVAVVVGDPTFSQVGHPWMGSDDPPEGQELTFEYVRVTLIETSAGATSLDVSYPVLVLARIDIPANTTTITDAMITDLRQLARPRTQPDVTVTAGVATDLTAVQSTFQRFPNVPVRTVRIPSWATTAKVVATVEGVRLTQSGRALFRPYIEGTSIVGSVTNAYEDAALSSTLARRSYTVGGVLDVSSLAGTTRTFSIQGACYSSANQNIFKADTATSVILTILFEE